MTLSDILNKKDKLGLIYEAVKADLEKRTDWQAYQGNHWRLRFVGIRPTGEIQAIVYWYNMSKEQYIGMSWENAFDASKLNAL
jgi:hypothetical protein